MNSTILLATTFFLSTLGGGNAPCQTMPLSEALHTHKASVMVIGAYHFVSKANVHNIEVEDP